MFNTATQNAAAQQKCIDAQGCGFGLKQQDTDKTVVTKAIFDSHKAELIVDSEEGMGSEFKVLFPMRENETA